MRSISDYHVHSNISPDSSEPMVSSARRAAAVGLTEIAFTDHYDEDYPYEGFDPPDFERYFANVEAARREVPNVRIRTGMELGMMRSSNDKIRKTLAPYTFDFVLFSKHLISNRDPWYEDFLTGWTLREAETRYLEEMLEDIRAYDDFDVVGHIGYVDKYLSKYGPGELRPFVYADLPDQLDVLLRTIIDRGKGIEVNTSSFGAIGMPMPNESVLRRYRAFGGEIVTLGSDAHSADCVGQHFDKAQDLLRHCGFEWTCTFSERKPKFHRL